MYYLNNPTKKKQTTESSVPKPVFIKPQTAKTFFIPNSWHNMGIILTWSKVKPLLDQQGFTIDQGKQGYLSCQSVPDNEYPFLYIPKYEPKTTSESLGLHT